LVCISRMIFDVLQDLTEQLLISILVGNTSKVVKD
jgi:hypothetical protein